MGGAEAVQGAECVQVQVGWEPVCLLPGKELAGDRGTDGKGHRWRARRCRGSRDVRGRAGAPGVTQDLMLRHRAGVGGCKQTYSHVLLWTPPLSSKTSRGRRTCNGVLFHLDPL